MLAPAAARWHKPTMRLVCCSLAVLAVLVVPVLADPYVACDNGLRCFVAPCPSITVVNLETKGLSRVTGIDVSGMSSGNRARVSNQLRAGRIAVDGTIRIRQDGKDRVKRPAPVLIVRKIARSATLAEQQICRSGK